MKTKIIAEIGVNHNGDLSLAKDLIDIAKECGADIAKFQCFNSSLLVTKNASQADYQKRNYLNSNQLSMLSKLELSKEEFLILKEYCNLKEIEFLSTAFDDSSIDFLKNLELKRWKIPSGEITNYPYLKKIAGFPQPKILSTGMSDLHDIDNAIKVLQKYGTTKENIAVLHCTSEYPVPINNVNLKAMQTIKNEFDVSVGYSDHSEGVLVPIIAVSLGAQIIEKHLTINKNLSGPDHLASAEPETFKEMVDSIRDVETALGDGEKKPSSEELKNRKLVRKSIVAKERIKMGEVFNEENIGCKRPGYGISPFQFENLLGKISQQNYEIDDLIDL